MAGAVSDKDAGRTGDRTPDVNVVRPDSHLFADLEKVPAAERLKIIGDATGAGKDVPPVFKSEGGHDATIDYGSAARKDAPAGEAEYKPGVELKGEIPVASVMGNDTQWAYSRPEVVGKQAEVPQVDPETVRQSLDAPVDRGADTGSVDRSFALVGDAPGREPAERGERVGDKPVDKGREEASEKGDKAGDKVGEKGKDGAAEKGDKPGDKPGDGVNPEAAALAVMEAATKRGDQVSDQVSDQAAAPKETLKDKFLRLYQEALSMVGIGGKKAGDADPGQAAENPHQTAADAAEQARQKRNT